MVPLEQIELGVGAWVDFGIAIVEGFEAWTSGVGGAFSVVDWVFAPLLFKLEAVGLG